MGYQRYGKTLGLVVKVAAKGLRIVDGSHQPWKLPSLIPMNIIRLLECAPCPLVPESFLNSLTCSISVREHPRSNHNRQRFHLTSSSLGQKDVVTSTTVEQIKDIQPSQLTHPELVLRLRSVPFSGSWLRAHPASWVGLAVNFPVSPQLQPECLHLWCHVQYMYICFIGHLYNGGFFRIGSVIENPRFCDLF